MKYDEFLKTKEVQFIPTGFDCEPKNEYLFDFQKAIVKWALKKGRCALFLDTGLGKTICQLSWADEVCKHENKNVLILAPLAVAAQTKREGEKFGIEVNICRTQEDVKSGINITNYEMIDHFNPDEFIGVVLDESSILKSFSGKTTQSLIDKFSHTKYKLACTATPAPNDYQELGNHSEFLGVCTRVEMLATYFIHDWGDTAKWRIKGHAENEFWKWVATWASVVKSPYDIGFDGSRYELPKLNIITHTVKMPAKKGALLAIPVSDLADRREARKDGIDKRVAMCADIAQTLDTCLVWCDYNDEGIKLTRAIDGAVEVAGANTSEHKEKYLLAFGTGELKKLVSKPSIAGFGMNWQNCNNIIFCGLSDSYEKFYQAIRRCWRFGQEKEVTVHIVISNRELPVLANIKKKEQYANNMSRNMTKVATEVLKNEIQSTRKETIFYTPDDTMLLPNWEEMYGNQG